MDGQFDCLNAISKQIANKHNKSRRRCTLRQNFRFIGASFKPHKSTRTPHRTKSSFTPNTTDEPNNRTKGSNKQTIDKYLLLIGTRTSMNWMMFGCRSDRWLTISRYTFSSICGKKNPLDQHNKTRTTGRIRTLSKPNRPKPFESKEQRSQGSDPVAALDELDGDAPSGLAVAHQPRHPEVARPDVPNSLVLVHDAHPVRRPPVSALACGSTVAGEEVGRKGRGRGVRRAGEGARRARRIGGRRWLGGGGGAVWSSRARSCRFPVWRLAGGLYIYRRCTVGARRTPQSVPCSVSRKEALIVFLW